MIGMIIPNLVIFGMERVEKKKEPNAFSEVFFSEEYNMFIKLFYFWKILGSRRTTLITEVEISEAAIKRDPKGELVSFHLKNINRYKKLLLIGYLTAFLNFIFLIFVLTACYFAYRYFELKEEFEKAKTSEQKNEQNEQVHQQEITA